MRGFSETEQDAEDLATAAGMTAKQVRVAVKKLERSGILRGLEPAIVRKREGGRTTSHYRGEALKSIVEALTADNDN